MTKAESELVSAAFDLELGSDPEAFNVRRFLRAREEALKERLGERYEEYVQRIS